MNQHDLELVLQNMSDLVFIIDSNFVITRFYQGKNQKIYMSESEFIDQHLLSINIPEKQKEIIYNNLIKVKNTKQVQRFEYDLVMAKEIYYYDMIVSPITNHLQEIECFVCAARDITRIKTEQKLLAEAKQKAEEASQAKSNFMANMNHELRTPLNGVLGFAQLLLEDNTLSNIHREYIENIVECSHTLLHIIENILSLTKIEAGHLELQPQEINLIELAERVVTIFKPQIIEKKLSLILYTPPNLPLGYFDEVKLKQVLINLISNAIKFTSQGEVKLTIDFQPQEDQTGIFKFQVSDTGIGIDPSKQLEIFEPFMQADISTSKKYGGTGLGLSIAQQIVKKMGGIIKVNSEINQGSTFTFSLTSQYHHYHSLKKLNYHFYPNALISTQNFSESQLIQTYLSFWGIKNSICFNIADLKQELDSYIYQLLIVSRSYLNLLEHNAHYFEALPNIKVLIFEDESEEYKNYQVDERKKSISRPLKVTELFQLLNESEINMFFNQQPNFSNSIFNKKIKILIADDNEFNLSILLKMIRKILPNSQIYTAANGLEAIDCYKKHYPFEIIFMDIQMPELNGLEVTKAIRKHELDNTSSSYIVALTARSSLEEREMCFDAGMDEFIAKPINFMSLIGILAKKFSLN